MLQQNGAVPMPSFFVGKTVTNNRVRRFIETKHQLLSDALGKAETKAIWYSKDHVAQWLSEIDKAGADGMRIYFGAQGEEEDYPGQLCLLMVLTKANPQTGGHVDFTVENASDFEARSFGTNEQEHRKRDFNTGSPCPPICDEGMGFPQ
jgi:hypothetical protein